MATATFMCSAPWRCVSRPLGRFAELGPHRRWVAQVFDLGPQPSCRLMSKVVWLSSRKQPGLRPATEASKGTSETHVMLPRPSSVPFKEELVNTVHLIGKLEDDVKVRMLAGGQAVANVWLAVQKSANAQERPSWFDLLFWGSFAISAGKHLKKGNLVQVTGKVTVDPVFKSRTVRVFVLNLNWVRKSQNSGAAMAHRPPAGTPSSITQHPDNNKIVEKKQRRRKDHPKPVQRFIKLHPNKEQAIRFGHSLQKLETMLKQLENGTDITSLESRNDGWEAFKRYCILRWHVRVGAKLDLKIA